MGAQIIYGVRSKGVRAQENLGREGVGCVSINFFDS